MCGALTLDVRSSRDPDLLPGINDGPMEPGSNFLNNRTRVPPWIPRRNNRPERVARPHHIQLSRMRPRGPCGGSRQPGSGKHRHRSDHSCSDPKPCPRTYVRHESYCIRTDVLIPPLPADRRESPHRRLRPRCQGTTTSSQNRARELNGPWEAPRQNRHSADHGRRRSEGPPHVGSPDGSGESLRSRPVSFTVVERTFVRRRHVPNRHRTQYQQPPGA